MKQTITVITPTLNNQKDIKFFLESIRKQKKINFQLEHLIIDGGSVDKTKKIAKEYKCKILKNPYVLPDPGVNIGINNAKGDILIVLAVDNIFIDIYAFEKILNVFKEKTIIGAFPLQASLESDSIFSKYINEFTDPFSHFVYKYAANGRTFKKIYKTIFSNTIYDIYDFSSNENMPLIAFAQGFAVRKGFKRSKENNFDDIMPIIELIKNDKKIAFMHGIILYHHTVRNLRHFMNKQIWATINVLQDKKYGIAHRESILSDSQRLRVKIWPIYSLTILPPFPYAFYHLLKDREKMWIFHPFLCIISGYSSLFGAVKFIIDKNAEYKRK